MKTYAEVITHEAQRIIDQGAVIAPAEVADTISFIYDVLSRDVEIDIDDEYQVLLAKRK